MKSLLALAALTAAFSTAAFAGDGKPVGPGVQNRTQQVTTAEERQKAGCSIKIINPAQGLTTRMITSSQIKEISPSCPDVRSFRAGAIMVEELALAARNDRAA